MGVRRLALLVFVAACPAKSSAPAAQIVSARPGGGRTAGNGSGASLIAPADLGSAATPATPAQPAGLPSNATLAEAGIEATSLDRSADPCVDFYQFACGGWLEANQIPADRSSWGRMAELDDHVQAALQGTLEAAAQKPGDKAGDYYAACMDEAAIEKAGIGPIKSLLTRTQGVRDAKSWFAALSELHKAGISAVWRVYADAGLDDASRYLTWLDAGGLGLPDRDYYDKPQLATVLAGYKAHVQRMLALAGVGKPDAASDVVAIESALAKLTKTAVEKRDPGAMNNLFDLKALAKQTKSVDWKAYFKALGITPSAKLIVGTPRFFAAIDALRKDFKWAQWTSYFTYHLLIDMSAGLPKAYDDEAFALEKLVQGTPERLPRAKRCIQSTSNWLGELVGKQYVDKYFSAASKQTAKTLFDAVAKVMNDDFEELDWMSASTKKIAQDKLAKIVPMIGFPDKWRTYDFPVKRDDFAGNILRGSTFETKRVLAKSGKPYDRGEWLANTFEINAYYSQSANNTALLAGILQGGFFGAERSIAANMGGIGIVIGHELTHGFDDQGAKFDAQGNLKNWWAAEDKAKFSAKGTCVAEQYSTFEVLPKQFINGQLTLGENIADLGGAKMAFKAYRLLRKDAEPLVADGFTEDQVFFLSMGQLACDKVRPEEIQRALTTSPHSPRRFRVYGALRNLPEFAQAFSCAAGTPMRPAQSCSVW